MKTLHFFVIAIIFFASTIVMINAFAQNDTYPPLNDLGDGNPFFMAVKGSFLPGQLVEISGNLVTVDPIQIVLDNPQGMMKTSTTTFSDRDGYFTTELKIPTDAEAGNWTIVGTSGIYHKELNFTILENSDTLTCYGGNLCPKPLGITSTHPVIHGTNLTTIQSPLKQLRQGTKVEDILCQPNLILILNHHTANVACVRPHTLDRLASVGWTEVQIDPKLLHMSIHVSGSYVPLTLQDHFLKGSLQSQTGPLSNATVSISANGVPMGTTKTFPDGCFQFDNWDEKKFSPKIDEYVNQDRTQLEHSPKYILFSARYLGDENHYAISAQTSSYLYLSLPPIAPAMYMIEPQSLVENLTQGNTTQFQLEIKPILKQSEIENPHLVLHPIPCGLDYGIQSVGDGKITQDNGGKFVITLKTSNYVPPGKYFIIISNNPYPENASEQNLDDIGGFVLNVMGK